MHRKMAAAVDSAIVKIRSIQREARTARNAARLGGR
jgi:phosphoketolase